MYIIIQICFQAGKWSNEIAKPRVSINPNNSSLDCKKTATGNGNLQPETESNEYSSGKKNTTRVVYYSSEYSSSRVLAAALTSNRRIHVGRGVSVCGRSSTGVRLRILSTSGVDAVHASDTTSEWRCSFTSITRRCCHQTSIRSRRQRLLLINMHACAQIQGWTGDMPLSLLFF